MDRGRQYFFFIRAVFLQTRNTKDLPHCYIKIILKFIMYNERAYTHIRNPLATTVLSTCGKKISVKAYGNPHSP